MCLLFLWHPFERDSPKELMFKIPSGSWWVHVDEICGITWTIIGLLLNWICAVIISFDARASEIKQNKKIKEKDTLSKLDCFCRSPVQVRLVLDSSFWVCKRIDELYTSTVYWTLFEFHLVVACISSLWWENILRQLKVMFPGHVTPCHLPTKETKRWNFLLVARMMVW